jgi:hypothetical protein
MWFTNGTATHLWLDWWYGQRPWYKSWHSQAEAENHPQTQGVWDSPVATNAWLKSSSRWPYITHAWRMHISIDLTRCHEHRQSKVIKNMLSDLLYQGWGFSVTYNHQHRWRTKRTKETGCDRTANLLIKGIKSSREGKWRWFRREARLEGVNKVGFWREVS